MGTKVRVSPSAFSDSLQISVYDDDLVSDISIANLSNEVLHLETAVPIKTILVLAYNWFLSKEEILRDIFIFVSILQKPGMSPAVYEYILTGLGSSIFAVDQRGYVYLNAPYISADPPNPSTYQLNVSDFFVLRNLLYSGKKT